jgi:hypothetical protein
MDQRLRVKAFSSVRANKFNTDSRYKGSAISYLRAVALLNELAASKCSHENMSF